MNYLSNKHIGYVSYVVSDKSHMEYTFNTMRVLPLTSGKRLSLAAAILIAIDVDVD